MTNPQGTEWESEIVRTYKEQSYPADRYPKRGQKGEPDLYIGPDNYDLLIPALFWKRLVGKKGNGPRQPDGERKVVVLRYNDFQTLMNLIDEHAPIRLRVEVQAKWTKALNVTRVLGDLWTWTKEHRWLHP